MWPIDQLYIELGKEEYLKLNEKEAQKEMEEKIQCTVIFPVKCRDVNYASQNPTKTKKWNCKFVKNCN